MSRRPPDVAVVDTRRSNIDSVLRALAAVGGAPRPVRNPEELGRPDRLVLPGVGSFADGMAALHLTGLVDPLTTLVSDGVPVLGICLGMQLLASTGEEGGRTPGLGWIPGSVRRLEPRPGERVPHIGWNEVRVTRDGTVLDGVSGVDFYFVHGYHLVPDDPADVIATTPYCDGFVSAVGRGTVSGVQFHPEKSQRAGLAVLAAFVGGGPTGPDPRTRTTC